MSGYKAPEEGDRVTFSHGARTMSGGKATLDPDVVYTVEATDPGDTWDVYVSPGGDGMPHWAKSTDVATVNAPEPEDAPEPADDEPTPAPKTVLVYFGGRREPLAVRSSRGSIEDGVLFLYGDADEVVATFGPGEWYGAVSEEAIV